MLCEVCNTRVGLGRGKTSNYKKTHKASTTCLASKAKGEKEAKRLVALAARPVVKPNKSLLSYMKPVPRTVASSSKSKPSPTPSTNMPAPASAHITILDGDDEITGTISPQDCPAPDEGQPSGILLVRELKELIARLPETIPEGVEGDVLARYGKDPKGSFDYPGFHGEAIWEAGLNGALKDGLGWGDGKTDWDVVIRRGKWGVDSLVRLVEYFVGERGVPESLFEGKLTLIRNEMEKRYVFKAATVVVSHVHSHRSTERAPDRNSRATTC